VIFATSHRRLSEIRRVKRPVESGNQFTCSPAPRCGIPRSVIAPELVNEKSNGRGLSTRVDTLSASVLGEKRRFPAKYPDVTN